MAMLVQAYAVVKSAVMNAPHETARLCDTPGMAGMQGMSPAGASPMSARMDVAGHGPGKVRPAPPAPCAWCADAAPIPLAAPPPAPSPPTRFSYAAYVAETDPPAPPRLVVRPKARGPPAVRI